MNKTSCQVQNLAEDGPTRIGYCQNCRVFHLQFGYITLHISPEAFVSLGATINTALAIFQRQHESTDEERSNAQLELKNALH